MTVSSENITAFISGFWSRKRRVDASNETTAPRSARVTKAEIQDLFDLSSSGPALAETLMASERLQRKSTEMIRGEMYKSN